MEAECTQSSPQLSYVIAADSQQSKMQQHEHVDIAFSKPALVMLTTERGDAAVAKCTPGWFGSLPFQVLHHLHCPLICAQCLLYNPLPLDWLLTCTIVLPSG